MDREIGIESVDWHDVPIEGLRFLESGFQVVFLLAIDGCSDYSYQRHSLVVSSFQSLRLDLSGVLMPKDLYDIEITSWDFRVSDEGLVSGVIGILPANRGYWEIAMERAVCTVKVLEKCYPRSGGDTGRL